jgi:hypothetical protein
MAALDLDRDGPAAGSILAFARPATAVKPGRSGRRQGVERAEAIRPVA